MALGTGRYHVDVHGRVQGQFTHRIYTLNIRFRASVLLHVPSAYGQTGR